jgi:3-hydroxyacyl-[acyl-carrier-protein] dehydratase
MPAMEITEILKTLPHRYPMLLVDRVLECDGKQKIVAIKNLTFNESFFQGHFPDDPVMPGVLQLEAMAQVGGILLNEILAKRRVIAYFLAVDNARFRRVVRPGDQLRIEVEYLRSRMGVAKIHGKIFVGQDLASEADLMFSYKVD